MDTENPGSRNNNCSGSFGTPELCRRVRRSDFNLNASRLKHLFGRRAFVSLSSAVTNVSVYEDNSYLVAIYPLNLVNKASDRRNNSRLKSILKSADFIELCVLTYCMQCPDVSIVACLTMLLELDNVNNHAIERATGFVSARSLTNIFLYLALNARGTCICLLRTSAICAYSKACSRVFKMLDSLIA